MVEASAYRTSIVAQTRNDEIRGRTISQFDPGEVRADHQQVLKVWHDRGPPKQARLKECRALDARTCSEEHPRTAFSDKKVFTVEDAFIRQNHHVLSRIFRKANRRGRIVNRAAHAAQVMVWADACAIGKTPLVFVESGTKIGKEYYLKIILEKELLPWP
ncbi:hypothetical protein NECAME_14919 [Necator americanus]|uniref:Uncharacterized protein n=1 Tax=Necator americanus TaxID=51031 RepID=W2SND8_NECAM|nr:hypothetical protein NECAME_14919 [Necator americanus]ETN70217.1 hypothetical protein NECAME_14919 [Necator americanus]